MSQEKTIREWFELCDEPWAKVALMQTEADCVDTTRESLSLALRMAFHWASSPEGLDYWCNIYEDLQSKNQ